MSTVAVLPVKSFAGAKQRLAAALEPEQRVALATAMVLDTLDALATTQLPTIVVTAEPSLREIEATVIHDPSEAGQSHAALLGIDAAPGARRILLIPGDCPALDPDELNSFLASEADVVIAPDRHGSGTNALLLTPPTAIIPSFGDGSFVRHAVRARAAGLTIEVVETPSLQHDVDTPADLDALRALLAERPDAAPRTRAALADLIRVA